jgi:hypothetical protein
MKTNCTEGTGQGEAVDVSYEIPDQEEVDNGKRPYFLINCLSLMCDVEGEASDSKTAGVFMVDAEALFLDEARDQEQAEIVALWLEEAAKTVRRKFKAV